MSVAANKWPVADDHGLPDYKERCIIAWNFGAAYDKCLWNAIFLGLRSQKVYVKCFTLWDSLASTDVSCIVREVNNSDGQLSIMQNLGSASTAATTVQILRMSELLVMNTQHNKKEPSIEAQSSGHQCQVSTNPVTAVEQYNHIEGRASQPRILIARSVLEERTPQV